MSEQVESLPVVFAGADGAVPEGLASVGTALPPDFGMSLAFARDRTVLAVRGELDMQTAPAFGAFLEVAASRPGCLVVVDLADLSFIDASGLGQLARVRARLRKNGSRLAITAPSPMAYKLLELARFTGTVHVERPTLVEA